MSDDLDHIYEAICMMEEIISKIDALKKTAHKFECFEHKKMTLVESARMLELPMKLKDMSHYLKLIQNELRKHVHYFDKKYDE